MENIAKAGLLIIILSFYLNSLVYQKKALSLQSKQIETMNTIILTIIVVALLGTRRNIINNNPNIKN